MYHDFEANPGKHKGGVNYFVVYYTWFHINSGYKLMNAQSPLPRVTYSNIGADFSTLHDWLDEQIPLFLSNLSDQNRCNVINGVSDQRGKPFRVTSPINKSYCLGSFIDADQSAIDDAVEAARKAFPGWASQPW